MNLDVLVAGVANADDTIRKLRDFLDLAVGEYVETKDEPASLELLTQAIDYSKALTLELEALKIKAGYKMPVSPAPQGDDDG